LPEMAKKGNPHLVFLMYFLFVDKKKIKEIAEV
jgi:hypothetical protein